MCPRGHPRGQGRPRGLHLCSQEKNNFDFVKIILPLIRAISHMYADSFLKNVHEVKYSCCIFWICEKLSTL